MCGWSSVRDRLGLVLEPPQLVLRGQRGRPDHLERDRPVEADLAGLVDDPHAAAAQLADQLVVAEVADASARRQVPIAFGLPAGRDRLPWESRRRPADWPGTGPKTASISAAWSGNRPRYSSAVGSSPARRRSSISTRSSSSSSRGRAIRPTSAR